MSHDDSAGRSGEVLCPDKRGFPGKVPLSRASCRTLPGQGGLSGQEGSSRIWGVAADGVSAASCPDKWGNPGSGAARAGSRPRLARTSGVIRAEAGTGPRPGCIVPGQAGFSGQRGDFKGVKPPPQGHFAESCPDKWGCPGGGASWGPLRPDHVRASGVFRAERLPKGRRTSVAKRARLREGRGAP